MPLLNSAILLKTLIPTNSIWLKVIYSDTSWWRQPILNFHSQFCTFRNITRLILTQCDDSSSYLPILPSWIHPLFAQKNLHSFILTQLDNGSHLEFCQLELHHLGFSHNRFSSQSHSHLPILIPTIYTKENFTDSFWLSLMMAAILNSAMLDSDTAILDSNTLLSSLRFTQKHSPSTLTLTQTNSIWLTRWWQPSWILTCWIQPFCSNLWLQLIHSDSKSFILTEIDDGSHLQFWPSWIQTTFVFFSRIHSKTLSLHSDSDSN